MAFDQSPSRNLSELALLITDHINAMLAYWDKDLMCRFANSAYVDWFGKTKEEMINKMRIDELLGPLYEKNLPYIQGALAGKRQLFEREIPLPGGRGSRPSLATYIPDTSNGEVLGFFVHVADVSYLKELEHEVVAAKRETLQQVIEMEEAQKRYLVEILRENINQRLVGCKMIIESERKKDTHSQFHDDVGSYISEVIGELNLLCQEMTPTEIEVLGLREAVRMYAGKTAKSSHKKVDVIFNETGLEQILLKDKYAIFRIIQNFTSLGLTLHGIQKVEVVVHYEEPDLEIEFIFDERFRLDKSSKEYHTIACRVDYYSGSITEHTTGSETVFKIEFSLTGK